MSRVAGPNPQSPRMLRAYRTQRAISLGGQTMGIEPYHHPDVTLSDMMDTKR